MKSLSWSFLAKKIHRQHHFSFRGLFVIDKSGTLRQITINDLPVGRDVDETLRLVQVILIYLEIPKRRIFTNNLKEKYSTTMFYLMMFSRLSSSQMNMVRFALQAGGLVSHQLTLCSTATMIICHSVVFLWRDLPMRDM